MLYLCAILALSCESCHPQKSGDVTHTGLADDTPYYLTTPIQVCSNAVEIIKPYEPAVKDAVEHINRRVGCQVLYYERKCGAGAIEIIFSPDNPFFIARAHRDIRVVEMARREEIMDAYITYVHELGHMLGLGHDPPNDDVGAYEVSVMVVNISLHNSLRRMSAGLVLPMLLDDDAATLRERYCH